MLVHIVLISEILAAIICVHCIYGEKFKLDDKTAEAFLAILIILEIINIEHLNGIYSLLVYVVLFVYCRTEFKSSIAETTISLALCMVIVTAMQFICGFFSNMLLIDAEAVRDAVSNIMSLAVFISLRSTNRLHRLKESICKNSKFVVVLLAFMCLTVMIILLQGKSSYEVHMQYFVLVVPAIIMLLYSVLKWYAAQSDAEMMKERLCKTEEHKNDYENLLTKVRLRQHAFKNHIEAIFSFHYTYKTYEKLVEVQDDYCRQLMRENKYNDLVLVNNNVLTGFLYGKFQEAEEDGIEIDYKIVAEMTQCGIPIYYVIEMLGILFDNAMEALKDAAKKIISFMVCESDNKYEFVVKNPFLYVSFDEILEWFQLGRSEKGTGRGIGLYQLKCLCEEWDCEISCRNMEINGENWIVFYLKIGKADSI